MCTFVLKLVFVHDLQFDTMNRREKSWRCSKKSEISCEKCVENNQNITTMTLPCRCRGVIEWINCLLFDTLLLILEAAINLWMATKLGSYTEFFKGIFKATIFGIIF